MFGCGHFAAVLSLVSVGVCGDDGWRDPFDKSLTIASAFVRILQCSVLICAGV